MTASASLPPVSRGHDAPITSADQDLLGGNSAARAIHRVIRSTPTGWSTRIGLYGPWGSGKTSVLNLLEAFENRENSIVVRLSAWTAVGEGGVLRLFYEALATRLKSENIDFDWLTHVKRAATKAAQFAPFGRVVARLGALMQGLPATTVDILAETSGLALGWLTIGRADLEKLVKQLRGRRVVVFIDDLDRADPRVLPKTLLAMREMLDWPSFSFVLAFDKRVVAGALREYSSAFGENANVFLEKVIDVPFEVPVPTEAQRAAFAEDTFAACCPFLSAVTVHALARHLPREPRRMKLVARTLGVMKEVASRHAPGELDWIDLALYHIVGEAGPATLAWIARKHDADDWKLWLLDRDERDKKREQIREELRGIAASEADGADVDRIVEVGVDLFQRWQDNKEKVDYALSVSQSEPTFTRREFKDFLDRWIKSFDDGFISREIDRGAQRGAASRSVAAADLLALAVDEHQYVLDQMAESESEAARLQIANTANYTLELMERLWLRCDIPDVRVAARSGDATARLLAVVKKWVAWVLNPGESKLRQRERSLALRAAEACNDKERLYEETDPYHESHFYGDNESARIGREWLGELRAKIIPDIVTALLERFEKPDGLAPIASGEVKLAAWMLESPNSPLYTEARLEQQLESVFAGRGDSLDTVLMANAESYLLMLLHKARMGSWAGPGRLREIHERFPQLVPAAWAAAARCPVPYRKVNSVLELKSDLVAAGIAADILTEPEWLKRAVDSRTRLASTAEGGESQEAKRDPAR
jgi:hypothetical protein